MATSAPSAEPSSSSSTPDPPLGDPSPPSLLEAVDKLKFFLATAPSTFPASSRPPSPPDEDRALNRFLLPTGELISCVLWNGLYHITGTDIVRALNFRFLAFGRPVRNTKKFEEGVFSDLRNLKSGTDATLEEPKSEFLELLFKHNCIRTQKKQKVFYWFSVPHDRLFLDALDRDLKREKLGQESTTEAVREPALSFRWNPNKSLFDQFTTAPLDPLSPPNERPEDSPPARIMEGLQSPALPLLRGQTSDLHHEQQPRQDFDQSLGQAVADERCRDDAGSNVFGAFSLFEGSPAYKQRRRPLVRRKGGSFSRLEDGRPLPSEQVLGTSENEASMHRGGARSLGVSRLPTSSSLAVDAHLRTGTDSPSSYLGAPFVASVVQQTRLEHSAGTSQIASPTSTSAARYDPHPPLSLDLHPRTTLARSLAPSAPSRILDSPSGDHLGSLKTYVCPLFSCGRLFKRLEHLKRHVRTHTSEKPFVCSTCGKAFARSDNLTAHIKIHEKAGSHQQTSVELARRMEVEGPNGFSNDFEAEETHCSITNPSHSTSPPLSSTPHAPRPSAEGFKAGPHRTLLPPPSSHILDGTPSSLPPSPYRQQRSATPSSDAAKYHPSASDNAGLHRYPGTPLFAD